VTDALGVYLDQGDWKTAHHLLLKCALQQTRSTCGYVGVVVAGPRLRVLAAEGLNWDEQASSAMIGEIGVRETDHGYLEISDFETLPGRVVTQGEVLIANALAPGVPETGLPSVKPALQNFMGVPVFRGKEVVGVIAVANRKHGYEASSKTQLQMLVKQAGVLCDCYRRDLRESALEEQVRVSQKMEAIGLLAGGVAHDFNNLLQVIQGYTAIALDAGTSLPDRFSSLEQVRGAGQRAAQLTQQLLAFSRQQRLQKSDLDVNQAIRDLLRMIERLIGEHIAVNFVPGHGLGNVCADRAQFDQVLLNLCLNARDALPSGGRIAIQTENVIVNGAFRESHPWAKPGRYVLLSVSDNGIGMDRETQARIFEPFFSTKPKGKGTGLGLSVVYGVVKQHDGMVHVYSEPGKGTTFKIYLPIVGRSPSEEGPKYTAAASRGTETILLAEDDPLVRDLAKRILTRAGYHVLVANDGAEACALFAQNAPVIALVVLDVVMPQVSGPDAYKRMEHLRAGVPVIFCSGYAGSALEGYSFDAPGRRLLAKPYGADELLHNVRDALDQTRAS
jgi:signal transduction histidine kinase/ActR/RegA family two-component response regulator